MGLIFIRTIIVFITLLVIMRLMGKRQIGEMQPFELVITLLIAELACIPMSDTSIPLLYLSATHNTLDIVMVVSFAVIFERFLLHIKLLFVVLVFHFPLIPP